MIVEKDTPRNKQTQLFLNEGIYSELPFIH